MDITALYAQKQTSPEKILDLIGSDQNILLGMGVAMPPKLITSLADSLQKKALHDSPAQQLNLYYMHGSEALKHSLLRSELSHFIKAHPLFMSAHDREALAAQGPGAMLGFVPSTFHQVGRLLTEHIEPQCFMVTVSAMDKHGYFSLGTNADYGASVIRKADKVIVEVNPNMPRTFGECSVHISEIDAILENDTPLIEIPSHSPSRIDNLIADQIAEHINDGDTLQMGVGGVPSAVLKRLNHHKDLGLHTELFCPDMVDLIQAGVINGRKKTWMQHKHIFTLALGDRRTYDFMDDNPSIVGYPASWVNNPNIIRKNRNMVSVNAAIEVDLTGQINAEQLAGHPFSGTGGQLDFVRGAFTAPGGRSFIALNSTARKGTVSRIVPKLTGGAVTDTRMDTHYVATEYGCINLKGLSLKQRAQALISLAHPDFREDLSRQAHEMGML